MTEDEARSLAVLAEEVGHPRTKADARPSESAGGWEVVLLWDQGRYSFGTRLTQLVSLVDERPVTVDALALDVGMLLIDEPHGPLGERDADGRYWLD